MTFTGPAPAPAYPRATTTARSDEFEQRMLRRFAVTRSPILREELVRRSMPLARSLAMRYRRASEPLDDLIQVANLGLVKAVDGFDPDLGRPFAAYAVPTILGEIRRHFRDRVWNVRLPRGLQELTMKIDQATDELTEELGRVPTAAQIAGRIEVTVEDVLEGMEASNARRTASLDAPQPGEEERAPRIESLGETENGYDRVEANASLQSAELSKREWQVLRLRFRDQLTQTQIGELIGVSQMQVSRVSRGALRKLLAAVRGEADSPEAPIELRPSG